MRSGGTDKETFTRFYRTHRQAVMCNVISLLKCPVLSEDVTQEIFEKIWLKWGTAIRYMDKPDYYLIRSVRNACINKLKKIERVKKERSRYKKALLEFTEDADSNALAKELDKISSMAIEQLPDQTRLVCRMIVDGFGYKEIAIALNKTKHTILCQRQKGLARIRDNINQLMQRGLDFDQAKFEDKRLVFERKENKEALYHIYIS